MERKWESRVHLGWSLVAESLPCPHQHRMFSERLYKAAFVVHEHVWKRTIQMHYGGVAPTIMVHGHFGRLAFQLWNMEGYIVVLGMHVEFLTIFKGIVAYVIYVFIWRSEYG